jgi:polar amino acid transport system substrate-binding protein
VTTPLPQLLVDQAPDVLVVPFTEPLQVTTTALAVRKGDPDLLNFLDSWLTFHRQDGWLAARQDYWMHPANWIAGM